MNNRRILITEDERERILRMHENHAKRNNLNFGRLNEQAALEYTTEGEVKYEGFGQSSSSGNSYKAIEITIPKGSKVTSYPAGNGYDAGVQVKGKETKMKRGDVNITLVCGTGYFSYYDKQSSKEFSLKQTPSGNFAGKMQSHFCDGKKLKTNKTEEKPKKQQQWDTTCNGSDSKPYKYGCKSDVIKQVQGCLGFTGGALDGKFGTNTQTVIKNKLGRAYFVTNDIATLCPPQQTEIGGGGAQDDIIKLPTKSVADAAKGLSQPITPQEPISSTQTDQEETTALNDLQQATQEFNQGKGDLRKLKRVKRQLERILRRKDKFMDSQTKQTYQNSIADLDNKIKQLGG